MRDRGRSRNNKLEHEGPELDRIHAASNSRKALGYWIGFLRGVLASGNVETTEFQPLRAEAMQFLSLLGDPDALELIEDLDIWKNSPTEIYAIVENIIDVRSKDFVVETEKDELNELYGFCAGIACDNIITPKEVETLITRIGSNSRIVGDSRIRNLKISAQLSIQDGRITEEESADICNWISRLVGDSATDTGVATFGNVGVLDGAIEDAAELIFESRMFVLTGKFLIGPRKAVQGMISARGGAFKNTVCMNTNYLVVAAEASRDWRQSHEGLKIMRAMELRDQGKGPDLVHEKTLARALEY